MKPTLLSFAYILWECLLVESLTREPSWDSNNTTVSSWREGGSLFLAVSKPAGVKICRCIDLFTLGRASCTMIYFSNNSCVIHTDNLNAGYKPY